MNALSPTDHAVILCVGRHRALRQKKKNFGGNITIQGITLLCISDIMKITSPLITHARFRLLLLLLLCVGYSRGMPHVLRFGKTLFHSSTLRCRSLECFNVFSLTSMQLCDLIPDIVVVLFSLLPKRVADTDYNRLVVTLFFSYECVTGFFSPHTPFLLLLAYLPLLVRDSVAHFSGIHEKANFQKLV